MTVQKKSQTTLEDAITFDTSSNSLGVKEMKTNIKLKGLVLEIRQCIVNPSHVTMSNINQEEGSKNIVIGSKKYPPDSFKHVFNIRPCFVIYSTWRKSEHNFHGSQQGSAWAESGLYTCIQHGIYSMEHGH